MSEFEQHIHERMRQAYQRVFGGPGSPGFGQPYMEPPVDVFQTETDVVVIMEIAGIPEEEVELAVDGRTLTITGERKPLPASPRRRYSQMEIANGPFRRQLLLPSEVNAEAATANYKNGILEITLPMTRPTTGRHLRIIVQ
jgi:HSP20 family protein